MILTLYISIQLKFNNHAVLCESYHFLESFEHLNFKLYMRFVSVYSLFLFTIVIRAHRLALLRAEGRWDMKGRKGADDSETLGGWMKLP